MATLTETVDSREWTTGDKPSVTFHYQLRGVADDLTAKTLLENSTAATYDGLVRESIQFEPVWVDTTVGDGLWDCRVRYVTPDRAEPQVGESSFSFDTGGGTQHVTQSLRTQSVSAVGGDPAPLFGPVGADGGGGIGFNGDGFDGVDITVPVYNWSETHYLSGATVTEAYRAALFNLTGKVNNASFKGLAAGECLFLGASGSKRGAADWEITFKFAASPNRTGLKVGAMTSIDKKGWEYLWVLYRKEADDAAHAMVAKPYAAYVEKVYEEANFAALGIGT